MNRYCGPGIYFPPCEPTSSYAPSTTRAPPFHQVTAGGGRHPVTVQVNLAAPAAPAADADSGCRGPVTAIVSGGTGGRDLFVSQGSFNYLGSHSSVWVTYLFIFFSLFHCLLTARRVSKTSGSNSIDDG
jgi:hypothetical protein